MSSRQSGTRHTGATDAIEHDDDDVSSAQARSAGMPAHCLYPMPNPTWRAGRLGCATRSGDAVPFRAAL